MGEQRLPAAHHGLHHGARKDTFGLDKGKDVVLLKDQTDIRYS